MSRIDASLYPNIGAAMAATSAGDTLWVPQGRGEQSDGSYKVPTGGLIITGSFELHLEQGAKLKPFNSSASQPVIDIQVVADVITDRIWIHGGKLEGTGVAANNSNGIRCVMPSSGSAVTVIRNLVIENMDIAAMGDNSIYIESNTVASPANTNHEFTVIHNVIVENGAQGAGIYFHNANASSNTAFTAAKLDTVYMNTHKSWGGRFEAGQVEFTNCYFESCATLNTQAGSLLVTLGDYTLNHCTFENFRTSSIATDSARAIVTSAAKPLSIWGLSLINSSEYGPHSSTAAIVLVQGSGGGPIHTVIGPARLQNVSTFITVANAADNKIEVYEPLTVVGSVPTYTLPTGVHLKAWP